MKRNSLLKALSLAVFIVMLTGIVTYKSRIAARNAAEVRIPLKTNTFTPDSPAKKKKKPRMLPTSKSVILTDDFSENSYGQDTARKDSASRKP